MSKKKMIKKYFGEKQCSYCGNCETGDPSTPEGWFEADEDGDKICDPCKNGERNPSKIEWYGLEFACGCGPFVAYEEDPRGKECEDCGEKYTAL